MDLERLSVRLRPRVGWESVDLGLALARHQWRPVYAVWLTLAAPLALLLVSLLGWLGLLAFWWLLPLCESAVLFTLSRAVFGSVPSWKEALRAAPGLWRRGAGELLFRRLQPNRVLLLPLVQLEGLGGKKRRQRAAALAGGQDVSGQLMIAFVIFELGLWFAVIAFAMIMTPAWMGIDWQSVIDRFFDGTLARGAYVATSMLAATIVLALHPLYVSAGFALYLGRRTELEGWDLEIAFRRLARRTRPLLSQPSAAPEVSGLGGATGSRPASTGVPAQVLVIALAAAAMALIAPGRVPAQDTTAEAATETEAEPRPDPRELIAEIMTRPELQREETVVRWRLRKDLSSDREPDAGSGPNPILVTIVRILAALGEPLMWLAAAVTLVLLLRAVWKLLPEEPAAGPRRPPPPERLFGLDLRPESLPDDVPGDAEALWRAGRYTAALSLLYRGALGHLAAGGLELRESFTEDDCLRAAGAAIEPAVAPPRLGFFTELTRAWHHVASADRSAGEAWAQRLWSGWAEHFGESP